MQTEITQAGVLLDHHGFITQKGWMRQPLFNCNLENAQFYRFRPAQFLRTKRWDYYAIFTPQRFFSATIADLGYAGNIFVYTLDFSTNDLHEEGLVVPLSRGIRLPRNSTQGTTTYSGKGVDIIFKTNPQERQIFVSWPSFHAGRGIEAEINLLCPSDQESMTIVIPIEGKRFYYNRKINCLPAEGFIKYGNVREDVRPDESLGSLDWGRGVWAYRSFWNWASASGFLPDGRRVGLNLGSGFGDTSAATEDCLVLEGRVHKLSSVQFDYTSGDYYKPWKFLDSEGRLSLEFKPFKERLARTNLGIIFSEVHQMFGRYAGRVITDDGEIILLDNLTGFAEEHHARW